MGSRDQLLSSSAVIVGDANCGEWVLNEQRTELVNEGRNFKLLEEKFRFKTEKVYDVFMEADKSVEEGLFNIKIRKQDRYGE